MKRSRNTRHTIAAAVVLESVFRVCRSFVIFLTKAVLDFELAGLCLVVVHQGIGQRWPRGCTLTYRGKVIWTFQCCAQNPALKRHSPPLFFFSSPFFTIFSSFGLSVLVSSVRRCAGNRFSVSTCARRAIVVTVRASLVSSHKWLSSLYLRGLHVEAGGSISLPPFKPESLQRTPVAVVVCVTLMSS